MSLDGDAPVVRFRHRLTNLGTRPLDFVWGSTRVSRWEAGYRIDVPGRQAIVSHHGHRACGPVGTAYRWPAAPARRRTS